MTQFVRWIAVSLLIFAWLTVVLWGVFGGLREGAFTTPIGLHQYCLEVVGLVAATQCIGALGLLFLQNWGRLAAIVSSLIMAAYLFVDALLPQWAGIERTTAMLITNLLAALSWVLCLGAYVAVLVRPSVRAAMRSLPPSPGKK